MSFFDLSDGTTAKSDKVFSDKVDMPLIPDGTDVEAICEQAKWQTSDFVKGRFISLRWSVLKPSAHENRKVFQKIQVEDPAKRDRAITMLATIDANAGGKLFNSGKDDFTDEDLESALVNRLMVLKIRIYTAKDENTGEVTGEYNYVAAISPKGGPVKKPTPPTSDNDIAF